MCSYNLGTFRISVEKFHHLENDLRVPFLVHGPGVAPNSTSDALVNNVDLGATILDLAGEEEHEEESSDPCG